VGYRKLRDGLLPANQPENIRSSGAAVGKKQASLSASEVLASSQLSPKIAHQRSAALVFSANFDVDG